MAEQIIKFLPISLKPGTSEMIRDAGKYLAESRKENIRGKWVAIP